MPHVCGSREHQRPRHTEMCEKQLAKISVYLFPAFQNGQLHIAQAQALQRRAALRTQRDQRAEKRRDRVAEHRRHAMPIAGRAGAAVAHAARGENRRARRIGVLLPLDAADRTALIGQHADCAVAHKRNMQALELALQRGGNIECAVRDRKHTSAALDLERHADRLEKSHGAAPVEAGKGGIQEPPVLRHIRQQLLTGRIVRHIAAALAGDVELFAQPLVRLKQRDGGARTRRADRRHHSGGSAADDNKLLTHPRPYRKYRNDPTHAPAHRRSRKYPFPPCWPQQE